MEGCRNFPSITAAFDGQKSTQSMDSLCASSLLEIFSFDQASHIIFEVSAGDLDEIHQPADSKKAKGENIQNSCAHLADIKPMDSPGTNEDTQKQRHNLVFVADSIIPGIVLVHIRRGRLVGIGRFGSDYSIGNRWAAVFAGRKPLCRISGRNSLQIDFRIFDRS